IACLHAPFSYNDTAPTQIHPLSLHDALPISRSTSAPNASPISPTALLSPPAPQSVTAVNRSRSRPWRMTSAIFFWVMALPICTRSEEHTSELQSRENLVCRLLLEKKKNTPIQ